MGVGWKREEEVRPLSIDDRDRATALGGGGVGGGREDKREGALWPGALWPWSLGLG